MLVLVCLWDLKCPEFDSSKVRCNEPLDRREAKEDPLWLAAVCDKNLLSCYVDAVFNALNLRYNHFVGMKFNVLKNMTGNQLWALSADNLNTHSDANGDDYLDDGALFLRVVAQHNQ